MSAGRHTPGPWKWECYSLRPVNGDPDAQSVHTIIAADHIGWGYFLSDPLKTRAESHANKVLIAAAPELLAALVDLTFAATERFHPDDPCWERILRARDAIARARGDS